MTSDIAALLIQSYLERIGTDIALGHYIETDFRHYSILVKKLIDTFKASHESPLFLTGLCLSLFQWFNFVIDPSDAKTVKDVKSMRSDPEWVEYLKFVHALQERDHIDLYRCILCAEKSVTIKDEFKLVYAEAIDAQAQKYIVYTEKSALDPLTADEITNLTSTLALPSYECYTGVERAYLIIDEKPKQERVKLNDTYYKVENLKAFFLNKFQKPGHCRKVHFDEGQYGDLVNRKWGEDFFLAGMGDIKTPSWEFGLVADVIDFKKVRLWFVSKELNGFHLNEEGQYEERIDFHTGVDIAKNLLGYKWETF